MSDDNTTIQELIAIMARLRNPEGGCPWDLEQSFATIVPHTLEEAYEVADAIEREDYAALPDELGDLLFQVVFYARLGEEQGLFSFDTVVHAICDKLLRRHPHVFGEASINNAADQTQAWETIKANERASKQQTGLLDDVPTALPGTTRARKLQARAARVGFDWPDVDGAFSKLNEEVNELETTLGQDNLEAQTHELGDVLFSVVNVARKLDIDPEQALRLACQRFETRFRHVEHSANAAGQRLEDTDLDVLDRYWDDAKILEKQ